MKEEVRMLTSTAPVSSCLHAVVESPRLCKPSYDHAIENGC